ncbi:alpha/beta fold hydrolase [Chloroflexota bacterium]
MKNFRQYGEEPFSVAVIHGGPGAPGDMAPVARELSLTCGVLEPLQTVATLEGQVLELKTVLEGEGTLPVTLIGHSWGAMLGFILTARHPSLVKKLVLVGSGVFEGEYAAGITPTRLSRLSEEDRVETLSIVERLGDPAAGNKDALIGRFGELMSRADSYDPLPHQSEVLETQYDINSRVWPQAEELRSSGELLELGRKITCPVVVIHGDYDPHPPEGVKNPLSRVVKDFRFILLEKCGHYPWYERQARDRFFDILKSEI